MTNMTTFELDLSKSDSFIDGIQEIFKPPSVESSNNVRITKGYMKSLHNITSSDGCIKDSTNLEDYDNKNKPINISWKKPKSNSHEFCDSCGTFEGERLVCDRCPASFHLECLDPPIEIDEAPVGVWYCNRCTAIMKDEDDKLSSVSDHSHNKCDIEASNTAVSNGCSSNNGNMKRSAQSTSSGSSEITTEMLTDDIPLKKRKLSEGDVSIKHITALKNIQDVVQCINPKEFELPKNLIPGIKLPFSYKTQAEMKTKSVISMENGIIPRPLVTCFECTRTCLYGSLIQCDYCPLYFHLDCLDPPLVQLPSRVERWMCPNHVEQVIDNSGLIKTIRLSERMAVYEDIQKVISNIDEVDLLINFGLGRGFRFGSKTEEIIKVKPKIEVPGAVKSRYKFPPITKPQIPFNEQQRAVLQNLIRTSGSNIDISKFDPLTLLHTTLDFINSLHSFPALATKPQVSSRPGADKVRSRALLIPVSHNQGADNATTPTRMIYRNFDIGSGIDNDCVITGCKYVSPRHASISYMDNHFCFELINYSRYGTVVDDLIYYNDVSEKESHQVGQANQNIKDIRAFIDPGPGAAVTGTPLNSMRTQRDSDTATATCMCTDYGYDNCALNDCTDRGWESTAALTFGSVIRIGCQRFVFTEMGATVATVPSASSEASLSSHGSSVSGHSKSKSPPSNVAADPSEVRSPDEEKKASGPRPSEESLTVDMEPELVRECAREEPASVLALDETESH